MKKSVRGFTLLEILLVVGIIAILAGIVILAINPTKQLGDTRNAQRRSDVLTILNAIYQYSIDNNGQLDVITNDAGPIATSTDCVGDSDHTLVNDLEESLVGASSTYLSAIPHDPLVSASDAETDAGYYVITDPDSARLTVCAPNTEGSIDDISVTR